MSSVFEIIRLIDVWTFPIIFQRQERVRYHPEFVLELCSRILNPLTAHSMRREKGAASFPCGCFTLLMGPSCSDTSTRTRFQQSPLGLNSGPFKCDMIPPSGSDFDGFFWVIQSFMSAQTFRILSFLSGSSWVCEGPPWSCTGWCPLGSGALLLKSEAGGTGLCSASVV